jgi:predicted RNA-binding Zn ribbon-like protein
VASVEQPGVRDPAPEQLRLVQDLVNTVDLESGPDELDTPQALTAWVRGRGIDPGRDFDAGGLADVRDLREALREVCSAHAGAELPQGALATLERLLAAAPLHLSVDAEGGAAVLPAPGLTGAAALTAGAAAAIAGATADGTWPRLKACASDTCRWVYYDRSPAGRSRWCTMAICGSRAKMRAYRGRR